MTIVTLIPFNISQDCLVIVSCFVLLTINAQEVKDLIQNKASTDIPKKRIKLAVDHIKGEALTKVILLFMG